MTRSSSSCRRPRWLGLVGIVAVGCAAQGTDTGELGEVSLLPPCATCTQIAGPLAVGATATVDARSTFGGTRGVALTLRAVDPQIVEANALTLRGVAPGVTAVLAITPEGRVLDFLNLTTQIADQLGVAVLGGDGKPRGELGDSVSWLVGDDSLVRVVPRAGLQDLGGQLDGTFTASSDVVTVLPGLVPGEWRVVARQAGSAQLDVEALGLKRQLTVQVLP